MTRPLHLAWALALGACFTGSFLAGQPCTSDADCGPMLRCEDGACGGRPAGQTTGALTSSDPTTTGASGTSTADPTTGPAATTTTTTDTTGPVATGPDPSTSSGATTGSEACGIGRCKDFDLMLVIDDSPSMGDKTATLLTALISFGETIVPALQDACSIHIGIITTDKYSYNPVECQRYGALVRADSNGNACPFIEGNPYATLPDLDGPMSLICPFSVGSSGNPDERPIDAMLAAFSSQINNGCNAGFLRPDSFLTLVLITDEDDDDLDAQGHSGSSELPENLWYGAITNLKGSVDDMYMVGLLGDDDPACMWAPGVPPDGTGTEPSPHLRKLVQSFPEDHYALDSLCKPPDAAAYADLMQEVLAELVAVCGG